MRDAHPNRLVALVVAVALVGIAVALVVTNAGRWITTAPPPGDATIGGAFTLTAQDGSRVTDQDFRGRYRLVYFGYTSCPDACPTALATVAEALDRLGEEALKVQPILITVDPERDTPAVLAEYVKAFHPRLIGLTGTVEEIAGVAKAYKVYFAKAAPDADGGYDVDHSTGLFLMDPEGRFLTLFSATIDSEALAAGLAQYVE
jgi:protein SCO1/2